MPVISRKAARLEELANSQQRRRALVVGNGESRLGYDPLRVAKNTIVFGCNAVYRDFTPHYLGAVDERMTEEIVHAYRGERYSFVGEAARIQQWRGANQQPSQFIQVETESDPATGPMMVYVAAVLGCNPIYLMGFDVGWTPRAGLVNSTYRDTPLYARSEAPLTCHVAHWTKRLSRTFSAFPERSFRQIGPSTLPIPGGSWEELLK